MVTYLQEVCTGAGRLESLNFRGDYDLCACVGTHVSNTAEIAPFRILSHDYNPDTRVWRMRFKLAE